MNLVDRVLARVTPVTTWGHGPAERLAVAVALEGQQTPAPAPLLDRRRTANDYISCSRLVLTGPRLPR